MPIFGLLNIDKPAGWTSRDVVNHVERVVAGGGRRRSAVKVGHAGTLDPLATGVLVVCLGSATRLVEYVQRMPKRYAATFELGRQSDTEDTEGAVTLLENPPQPSLEAILAVSKQLVGQIEQMPPQYSAIKVGGKRAYKLARAGKRVDLKPRIVRIDAIEVSAYDYPRLDLDIRCGAGTYIRSLGRDLANAVETNAVMSRLRRTAVGRFLAVDAVPPDALRVEAIDEHLRSPTEAVTDLPARIVTSDEACQLANGLPIPQHDLDHQRSSFQSDSEWAAVDRTGQLVAILTYRHDGQFWPKRNFTG